MTFAADWGGGSVGEEPAGHFTTDSAIPANKLPRRVSLASFAAGLAAANLPVVALMPGTKRPRFIQGRDV